MTRLFFILVAAAVLVWFGQRYFIDHPNGQGFWDSVGSPPIENSAPKPGVASTGTTGATPAPTPTLAERLNGWRTSIRTQTQKILMPLDTKDFSASDAERTLEGTQREIGQYLPDPKYTHLMLASNHLLQACAVLRQALVDRQDYTQRYQRDAATPAPATPSPLKMSTLEPAASVTDSADFFKQRALTEWNERANYYRPIIEGLLTAPN